MSLRSIFVSQQVVQSSGQIDEETQSGVAVNSGRNDGGQSAWGRRKHAKRRRTASRCDFREAGGSASPIWGTPLLHTGAICSRIPGYAHPLPRRCVSAEKMIDRTVTSSRP